MKFLIIALLFILNLYSKDTIPKSYKGNLKKVEFNKYGIGDVLIENEFYAINRKGKVLFKIYLFDNGPDYFEEGLRRFVENGKIGFVNNRGQKIISAQYEFIFPFQGGIAEFCSNCEFEKHGEHTLVKKEKGKWGKINKKGKLLK